MKPATWILFVFFAVGVGLYPLAYLLADMKTNGLMATKTPELLANAFWTSAFYLHISLGGISLLTGWSQFSRKLRARKISLHRTLGKIYLISVIISGLSALYIAVFATGGLVSQTGFSALAILWLISTWQAYVKIRRKEVDNHEQWMIRSYALTFAAVTLRLWMPVLIGLAGMEFMDAYRIIAWLCWVPNLLIAEWMIRKPFSKKVTRQMKEA